MRELGFFLLMMATNSLAHDGHGAGAGHLHLWEYGILGAAAIALALLVARRRR